jgi:hypothetical protein
MSSTVALAQGSERFEVLLKFFDNNEAAMAYNRQCRPRGSKINYDFLKIYNFIESELINQSATDNPTVSLQYIRERISVRRNTKQLELETTNMRLGCNTKATLDAKNHYESLSRYKITDFKQAIDKH